MSDDLSRLQSRKTSPADAEVPLRATPVVDDAIQRTREIAGDGWRELRDTFLRSAAETIEGLAEAVDAGRVSEVGRLAHTLRGGSGVFGAKGVASLCATLEEQARRGDIEGSSTVVREIRDAFEGIRASLASMERDHA
jgi:HPt (histidine-containing phosphotransfer) domain-containing protein